MFGVIFTHGMAGFLGGLMVGIFADPYMVEYVSGRRTQDRCCGSANGVAGLAYGNSDRLLIQFLAACTVILWDVVVTFILLKIIGLIIPLRYTPAQLEEGDIAVHGEEVEPSQLATRSTRGSLATEGAA